MADVATLGIKIENGSAIVAVDQLASKLDFLGVRGESTVARLKAAFGGLAAATGLTLLGAKFLKETIDAQNAMAQLEARVKSTGGAAGFTAKQLDDLSSSLQSVSTYSDEAVKGADAMLLTFSKVKGDTFTRATSDILDLAQAMGGDLQGAAIQVGKALQDPEQGMLALRRSGVSFSAAQQQMIKDLFNGGKEAEAQALILQELEKEFGGSAAAARNTLGGALKGLGNDFGDLFERTTDETTGLVGFINTVDGGVKSLHLFGEELKIVAGITGIAGVVIAANLATKTIREMLAAVAKTQLALQIGTGGAVWNSIFAGLTGTTAALTLVLAGLGLAIYDIDKAFEEHDNALEEASKNTKAYVDYLKALGHAHSQAGGAGQLHTKATNDEIAAVKNLLAERDLELRKLAELNKSYNQNDLAKQIIEARYDAEAQKTKDAVDHHGAELVALNKVTDAILAQKIAAAQIASAQDDFNTMLEKSAAFQEKMATALANTVPQWTINARFYERVIEDLKILNDAHDNEIKKIGQENAARGKAQVDQAAEAIRQTNKYQDDLQRIWRDGIAKITTDGFKSFLDFAEDLNQLFTKLMDRMAERARQLGKDAGGAGFKALGIGASALSGGIIGYQSGNAGLGAIGGALVGNEILPGGLGALVGGLAGLTGGLIGGAQAARRRREAEEALSKSLEQSILGIKNQLGTVTDLDAQIAAAKLQFDQLRAEAAASVNPAYKTAFGVDPSAPKIAELNALEQQYIEWLTKQAQATKDATKAAEDLSRAQANQNAEQDSHLRLLNATGQSDAAFAYQQSLELQKDVADGLSGLALSEVIQAQQAEAAQREQEKQTQLLQDQLSTAQQAYDSLKQVYDSLSSFGDSLKLGQYSPLSPRQQLDTSRGQLNTLYQAALGGDQAAASQFSGAAQSFLGASQKYNASGAGYVLDYNSVTVMTDALKHAYGVQLTDAQKQVSLLQQQLDVLKSIDGGTQILVAQRPLTPTVPSPVPVGGSGPRFEASSDVIGAIQVLTDRVDGLVAVSQAGFIGTIAAADQSKAAIETGARATAAALDAIAQKVS